MNSTIIKKEKDAGMASRGIAKFFHWNIAICDSIEKKLSPTFTRSLLYMHENLTTEEMNARSAPKILDIGGGRNSPFAKRKSDASSIIIAADVDVDELAANESVDNKVALDATQTLPFDNNSIDIIVTRSLMEHLPETDKFISECDRILKPDGVCVHVLPCRFSPFSLINQMIPNSWAQSVLYRIYPQWGSSCGFRAYYKNCHMPRIANMFSDNGLSVERVELRYYQSIYFKFFLPLYILSLAYDLTVSMLKIESLSCQVLITARKPKIGP